MERRCAKCKETKFITEFYRDRSQTLGRMGRAYICKICAKAESIDLKRKIKNKNLDGIIYPEKKNCFGCKKDFPSEQFYKDINAKSGLRTHCKKCDDERSKKFRDSLNGRYWTYKNNKHKREFLLTLAQFDNITLQACHYCNEFSENKTYSGVDRVNNSVGYELKNCVPCCDICNRMKNTLGKDKFLSHIRKIAARHPI